jgi:hypothetical protein
MNSTRPPDRELMNCDVYLIPTDGSGTLRNLSAPPLAENLAEQRLQGGVRLGFIGGDLLDEPSRHCQKLGVGHRRRPGAQARRRCGDWRSARGVLLPRLDERCRHAQPAENSRAVWIRFAIISPAHLG